MVHCPQCGEENQDNNKFCLNCGNSLENINYQSKSKKEVSIQDNTINSKNLSATKNEDVKTNNKKKVGEVTSSTNPKIDVTFFESMPGRASFGSNVDYIKGVLEIADHEIIVHKKSYFRGKDRGKKHLRYDQITSVDYDSGKFLSPAAIQLYMSSIQYSFRSNDKKLESIYNLIHDKIEESRIKSEKTTNPVSSLDELKKLAELKNMGAITEEEFEKKKKQLLDLEN
ncbi:MAG: zinc ribbon domain-containing protein [Methanobacteriaceae archaeon]|nr:zinc ribbon domain-containing protein [Methanobacteriaceae archaeon]